VAVLLPAKLALAAVPFLEWPVAEVVLPRPEPVVAVDDSVPQVAARALAEPVSRLSAAASELLMEQAGLVSATEAVVASRQVAAPVRSEPATDAAAAPAWWALAGLAQQLRRAAASELLMELAVPVSATEAVVASPQVAAPVRSELATDAATALAWWALAGLAQHLRQAAASELLMEQAVLVSATEAVAASRRAADRVRPELATDAAAGLA
jgi:hypothetical protein